MHFRRFQVKKKTFLKKKVTFEKKLISKSERIPLAGLYGLLLLNCGLLLSLIRDYNYNK